ncbi:RNA polymerase sigma-B factor [Mycolicibacterium sp. BK634]|uniref:SigB/SigF/SigG family RNA polymerase sigma factor n=1 Tax=Mycolicibacterium sp. BK634 TaxID=2587099 RepID=UPI001814767B|nr:SigB/SigF/SigG family RNA polymerase sigma factor [Mycolicibacterium sp. BK634]MBB3750801.1 RNA polymerase sigma-B factor [Mycolicibacterium sp. BK634]
MSTTEPSNDYADVGDMFRRLETFEKGTAAFDRQREAIVERTLPLADHVARRFKGRGEDYDDLYQVACVGLINAVNRFDITAGTEFLHFAVPTIMGEVRRHFRDRGWALKVPRGLKDMQSQLARAREELSQRSGRAPTPSELADHLHTDRETVVEAIIAGRNYGTVSTDAHIEGHDGRPTMLGDTLGFLDSGLNKVVDVETVRPLIEALPERERTVLTLRFFNEMSQTQIGQQLGISQMHVSRLLARTLELLRNQALPPDVVPRPVKPSTTPATRGRARKVVVHESLSSSTPASLAS